MVPFERDKRSQNGLKRLMKTRLII